MQQNNSTPLDPQVSFPSRHQHAHSLETPPHTAIVPRADARRLAPLNPKCIVCGAENANGLRLKFEAGTNGVHAIWVSKEGWESFQGTVHGGIITAVLDEAMSKAIIASGWEALTAELRVRFRGRVAPGDELQVRGWISERRKRRILAEATLATPAGRERAHAWAAFLIPPEGPLS